MRPRIDLPSVQALRAMADTDGQLAVHVTPGARSERIEIAGARVLVKVRAKPKDGKATVAVIALLGQALAIPASQISLLRGATSRAKVFKLPSDA